MKKILDEIVDLYFQSRFGKSPIALFAEWREEEIQRLAAEGKTGKEILDEIGLSHCSSLTRCLARHGKPGLREIQRDNRGGTAWKGRLRERESKGAFGRYCCARGVESGDSAAGFHSCESVKSCPAVAVEDH